VKKGLKIFLIILGILILIGLFLLFTNPGRTILDITITPLMIPFAEECGHFGGIGAGKLSEICKCDGIPLSEGKDGPSQNYCLGECSSDCKCYETIIKYKTKSNLSYSSSKLIECI
jgi:hypothetical protein